MASSDISKHTPLPQDLARTRTKSFEALLTDVRQIIDSGLQQAYQSVNQTILNTYWLVGRRIVEDEQHGNRRAEYGKQQIKNLSAELVPQYGTSYNERNLYQFRNFYLAFSDLEILNTRLQNLSWSHFSRLLRIENEQERLWYMQEAANEGWSFRTLDRNINTQYFRRILAMQKEGIAVPKEKEQPNKTEFINSETNGDVVHFSSLADNPQMYAAKYELYLPTQEELTREIERQKEIYRLQQDN